MRKQDRVRIRTTMLIAFMIVGGSPVDAQELPDSIVGKRVRVHFHSPTDPSAVTDPRDLLGRVEKVAADSVRLLLAAPGGAITFPVDRIKRLDISLGVDRPREAAITGIGGAAIFVALSFLEPMRDDGVEAALLGGTIGFVIGAFAGALLPDERWRRVYPR